MTHYLESELYDFGDGLGPVPAFRHRNPDGTEGGWVASTARAADTVFVGVDCRVSGFVTLTGNTKVTDVATLRDRAVVGGEALIGGNALVDGSAAITGEACIAGEAHITGNAQVNGTAWVHGNAVITGTVKVSGRTEVGGESVLSGSGQFTHGAIIDGVWAPTRPLLHLTKPNKPETVVSVKSVRAPLNASGSPLGFSSEGTGGFSRQVNRVGRGEATIEPTGRARPTVLLSSEWRV